MTILEDGNWEIEFFDADRYNQARRRACGGWAGLSMAEFVGVHTHDHQPGIGTVLIDREPTNALSRQAYRELAAAAAEVSRRDDIAAVILYGGHEIFSAGDDVPELRTLAARRPRWPTAPLHRHRRGRGDPQTHRRGGHRLRARRRAEPRRWPPTGGSAATTPKLGRPRSWPGWCPAAAGVPGWSGRWAAPRPRNWPFSGGSSGPRSSWRWVWSTNWCPRRRLRLGIELGAGSSTPRRPRWPGPRR